MPLTREEKQQTVQQYADLFSQGLALVWVDYRGLTASQVKKIRDGIRPYNSRFLVVKNTLADLALQQAGLPVPEDILKGPTAVVVCLDDVASTMKLLRDEAQESKILSIKGAILGEHVLNAAEAEKLADLPSREVLLAQVVGAIQAPLTSLVTVLAAPLRGLATVLKAHADQLAA